MKAAAGDIYIDFHRNYPSFFVARQNEKERSTNSEACTLLGYNALDNSYALLPPVLYKSFRTEDPNGLFRSEELMTVCSLLISIFLTLRPTYSSPKWLSLALN